MEGLYSKAKENNVSSTDLTLDHIDFLLSMSQPQKAEQLLSDATARADASTTDVRLWLKWVELPRQMMETLGTATGFAPSLPPVSILRIALKQTLLHDRHAYLSILTELMYHLMETPKKKNDNTSSDNSEKVAEELKQLF